MSMVERIRQDQAVLSEEMDRLRACELEAKKRMYLRCTSCGRSSQVRRWTFRRNHWYTPPYGCTGGDYWNVSGTKTCNIRCPRCHTWLYLYNHPQREKVTTIVGDKPYNLAMFAEVIEGYNG